MANVEKILCEIPPKILFDHYSDVIEIMDIYVVSDEEGSLFGVSDVKSKILQKCEELQNTDPFVCRIHFRALNVVDDVFRKLTEAGMLLGEGGKYRKSESFSELLRIIKILRASVKRWIAWAVYFLYCDGVTAFSNSDLGSIISFEDESYLGELPHLVIWKDKSWKNMLKKSEDKWRLVETPYRARRVLSTYLSDRLGSAVLELAESKDEFSGEEIIALVRRGENKYLEKTLGKLGLKHENEKWYVDETAFQEIKGLLTRHPISKWPSFAVAVIKKPAVVKLEGKSKNFYVDVPNEWISHFLQRIDILGREYENLERLHRKCLELKDEWNKILKENGNWLSFIVKRRRSQDVPIAVQVSIKWDRFYKFLEDFAISDNSLEEKYSYLSLCRSAMGWMRSKPHEHQMVERVKSIVEPEVKEINRVIDDISASIDSVREKLRNRAVRKRFFPLALAYLHEAASTFQVIRNCVGDGIISACYREMRKILEGFSWVIFEDYLSCRNKEFSNDFISPCRVLSKRWYDWARRENATLKSLVEFKKSIRDIVESYFSYGETKNYAWTKNRIRANILDNLSYPLFILLSGIDKQISNELRGVIPFYDRDRLKTMAGKDIEKSLRQLKGRRLSRSDSRFIENITGDMTTGKQDNLIVPYPSNRFVLEFVSNVLNLNLYSYYKRYSYFVHSYVKTWQLFPFSSVLEFKILKHELSDYTKTLSQAIQFCSENI